VAAEDRYDATPFLPARLSLTALRRAAAGCRGCPLHRPATQTVFGEGPRRAQLMLVGEMPGDREDAVGHVFAGPAGRELDRSLAEAGIDRGSAYLTNVVKHFKFEERGKRRIHQTPSRADVKACLPWLRAELEAVRPDAVVLLGATAAQALLGSSFRITRSRGRPLDCDIAPLVVATLHPAAIVRAPDAAARAEQRSMLVGDLRLVASALTL
jgi:uracil-DNA glycosylase